MLLKKLQETSFKHSVQWSSKIGSNKEVSLDIIIRHLVGELLVQLYRLKRFLRQIKCKTFAWYYTCTLTEHEKYRSRAFTVVAP